MKSNVPPSTPKRAALASAAAALACLVWISLAAPASSADSARQRKAAVRAAAGATPAPAATPTPTPSPTPTATPTPTAGQRVKLYYLREGTKVAAALNAMAAPTESEAHGMIVSAVADDELIVVGTKGQRKIASRIIAMLDLPRPGVEMEMWGVQISSRKPQELAQVMERVREEIDRTQQAVRATYQELEKRARLVEDRSLDASFKAILQDELYYRSALETRRPLSLSDILLRLVAADDPLKATAQVANGLDGYLRSEPEQARYLGGATKEDEALRPCKSKKLFPPTPRPKDWVPFRHFFTNRGLRYVKKGAGGGWVEGDDTDRAAARMAKAALLRFALNYGQLVHDPENFDPYYLQQSSGVLNTRLQAAIDALNQDIEEVFVAPTLDRIRHITDGFCDVEYAQVGKTNVASLSGVSTIVTSKSVNAFETIRPLSLTDFLDSAKSITDKTAPLVPNAATTNMLGTVPFAEVLGLVGALGQDRATWRELNSGISLTIKPNVLRNMTSAELEVNLGTGDPQAAGTREAGARPLTRVSQHDVNTKVYVNALDFFDLSAFASQATLSGGRAYVPIIGPFWRGLFGEAPVVGELLSWKKPPQTVYSQSLVLTTSFITPTAMGVALLVPTDIPDGADRNRYRECFKKIQDEIDGYDRYLFGAGRGDLDALHGEARQCVCGVEDATRKAAGGRVQAGPCAP
ncbi:MAG TPA: hypothetical protein VF736_24135 [Pyrinomonadaceae bacterium]|jgi:hypothetical protein